MVKTVDELKELIEWAKKARVKSLKVGAIEVELSDYAFIETLGESAEQATLTPDLAADSGTPDWTAGSPEEDKADSDAIMFHSSR